MIWLIKFVRGGRAVLRFFQHLQGGDKSIAQISCGGRAAPQVTSAHEFNGYRAILGHQDAGSHFNLDCAVHDAVCRYDIKVYEGSRAAVLVGWWIGGGSVGRL